MYFFLFNIKQYRDINISISHSFIKINNLKRKKPQKVLIYQTKKYLIFFSFDKFLLNYCFILFRNLLWSLTCGSTVHMKILGLGYKLTVDKTNQDLVNFDLGYSHEISFKIPQRFKLELHKSRKNLFKISGQYLYDVKNFGVIIKKLRKINVYKGKGIFFFNEKLSLKEGKKLNV